MQIQNFLFSPKNDSLFSISFFPRRTKNGRGRRRRRKLSFAAALTSSWAFLWWIESSRSPKWKCQPILHLLQHARKLSGGVCSNEIPSPPNLFIEEWEENDATIHRLICLHFLLRYAHKVRRARTRRSQSRIASSLVRSFDEKLPISWPRESLLLLFLLLENEAINSQREYFFCGRKGKRVTAE